WQMAGWHCGCPPFPIARFEPLVCRGAWIACPSLSSMSLSVTLECLARWSKAIAAVGTLGFAQLTSFPVRVLDFTRARGSVTQIAAQPDPETMLSLTVTCF